MDKQAINLDFKCWGDASGTEVLKELIWKFNEQGLVFVGAILSPGNDGVKLVGNFNTKFILDIFKYIGAHADEYMVENQQIFKADKGTIQ